MLMVGEITYFLAYVSRDEISIMRTLCAQWNPSKPDTIWGIYFCPLKRGVLYSEVYIVLELLTWDLNRSVL